MRKGFIQIAVLALVGLVVISIESLALYQAYKKQPEEKIGTPVKCLLRWNKNHTSLSCLELGSGEALGTITTSGTFPTSTNEFQDGDIINAGDWNNIENTIGKRNSGTSTTLFWLLTAGTSSNPGHIHTTSSITGLTSIVWPIAQGGTNATSLTQNSLLTGNGTDALGTIAPGAAGNVLTSNGTSWQSSSTSAGTSLRLSVYTPTLLSAGAAVYPYEDGACRAVTSTDVGFGATATDSNNKSRIAQSFTPATTSTYSSIKLKLKTITSPSDSAVISIRLASTTNPTFPDEIMMASGTIASGSLTGTLLDYTVNFNSSFTASSSQKYFVVFSRTGQTDNTNYYSTAGQGIEACLNSNYVYYTSSTPTWFTHAATGTQDIFFDLGVSNLAVERASAATSSIANAFIGFTSATASTGTLAQIDVSGRSTVQSNLLTGFTYYLGNSSGTIASSTGTFSKTVGKALSSSSILILP